MRVVFMGTPDFAVNTLDALVEAGHEVALVVTQPDKPRGRGKEMMMPPVKVKALEHGIEVCQPVKIKKDEEFLEKLKEISPDVIVVVAFGQLLPKTILMLPKYGCINVHASLLPMYRGAAPLQWVIINGEKVSGITTMKMDVGLDTGDMLLKEEVAIDDKETYESYHDKLAPIGAKLLIETLNGLENGKIVPIKQEGETCYASMIDKTLANIDWTKSAVSIERLIRGLNPAPCAFSHLDGKTVKIWDADVVENDELSAIHAADAPEYECGKIVNIDKNGFCVVTGDGLLRINELQLEGKKRMDTASFLRGYKLPENASFYNF